MSDELIKCKFEYFDPHYLCSDFGRAMKWVFLPKKLFITNLTSFQVRLFDQILLQFYVLKSIIFFFFNGAANIIF